MTNQELKSELSRLYAIAEAGEKGYATAAVNIPDQGLKLLLKSFARQRSVFQEELLAEIHKIDANYQPTSSIPGMVHRGRVAIFAAMTIQIEQRERIILKEAEVGERAAINAYRRALEKDLPLDVRELVEQQANQIARVAGQVKQLVGQEGKRMIVRLFNSETIADRAIEALDQNGIPTQDEEKTPFNKDTDLYAGRGATTFETTLSGAVGGAFWGILIGILASFMTVQMGMPDLFGITSGPLTWLLVTLAVIATGAMVGGLLGFLIGLGIAEDDQYRYQQSAARGQYLVRAIVEEGRVSEVRYIWDEADRRPNEPALGTSA
ncbi:MAG TPA: PA2169 family four-helix-bundle protein [Anaerolineaceae bacterium]|nr:PA2169 family four-helix-bundle protein [Anaerolineaceae bacterium]